MENDLQIGAVLLVGGLLLYKWHSDSIRKTHREYKFHVQEGLPENQGWTALTQTHGMPLNEAFLSNPH